MRVLVTGASGFVGRHVISALADRGAEVVACSRRRPAAPGRYRWHAVDLLDREATATLLADVRPTHVLHLAWTVDHGRFWEEPANLAWVSATLDLSGAAIRAGVSRIVAAGTCYEYEWPAHGACSEDMTPVQSHTLYDTAKDATRRVLEVFLRQSGCAFAWARLFYLYGAGEPAKRLVPSVARALISGRAAECSNGEAVRDLLEVRDAAAALAAVTCSDLEGPVNIASGVAVRIGEVAERLGRIAGRPDLVRLGIRPDRPQDPPRIVADVSKLSMETDFRKSIGLEDGLAAAIAHWRSLAGSH